MHFFPSLFKAILFFQLFESKLWIDRLKEPLKQFSINFLKPRMNSHKHDAMTTRSALTLLRRRWPTCRRAHVSPVSSAVHPAPGPRLAAARQRGALSPLLQTHLPPSHAFCSDTPAGPAQLSSACPRPALSAGFLLRCGAHALARRPHR